MNQTVQNNLTTLVARNLLNVVKIVGEASFNVKGSSIPQINQELATLEMLARRLEAGEYEVVEVTAVVEEADDVEPDAD